MGGEREEKYIPYPRVNCLKTIPFTAEHTYIAHIWQSPPGLDHGSFQVEEEYTEVSSGSLSLQGALHVLGSRNSFL